MVQIIVGIDGMACEMCEAHVNEAIRGKFPVKKVTSSHKKAQSVIISEQNISETELREALDPTGYKLTSYESAPYEKKGLFSRK
ncbi:MAG: heavy-metal-associated domain-containing protein [Lachnospiraceae bacterium]